MSLRTIRVSPFLAVVAVLACGCAGGSPRSDEPATAKDRPLRDAEAEPAPSGGKWAGWRYTGERDECFFVVGRRCFKTEAAACAAARCGKRACEITGGGPAAVTCRK